MNITRGTAAVGLGAVALLALSAVFGSFYTVDQGYGPDSISTRMR